MKKNLFKAMSKIVMAAVFAAVLIVVPKATEAAAYTYTNDTYGFSIECPAKPVGEIDLSRQPGGNKGVMLVFENEGMDVNCGWIIMTDAFTDENIPDLTKLTKEQVDQVLKAIVAENGIAAIVKVEGQPAIYTIAQTEDMAKTYIRGKNGKKYVVALTANKTIFRDRINPYQLGLMSFKTK
ncbi:MAG: hypothetical protein K0Q53_1571 [Massilibacillus sp.]|jgi:hypothetical protein|nr:hypothetical protein [Massilibacillus sp.]